MCKVYLYSRVSTSAQTLAQQERTVYEWLNNHNMKVGEIISDEGVSGGVSYKDRNLGKILLPKLVEGDMLIVSEISRLGRSMFDLSKLIHTELKPRKVRLVVCNMSIDLNCSKMTAIDELILNNFSFAAQLEKQLISERTLSALEVKRKQGVKFGAASPKYQENYNNKTKEERIRIGMERGQCKRMRYQKSRKVTAFLRVIKETFVEETASEDPHDWDWDNINTKGDRKDKMLSLMKTMRDLDENKQLFKTFNFDANETTKQQRLGSLIFAMKRTFKY